ncbi:hypothetical protein SVIO_087510 [Streptomyces violaceusniger]|uniref:Uncharacterized protein n=2 Tax=Streptomyces violaceusniger TaxID=68280 RepID=A0A4D4LI18_STRVO|nr:hypothetical protein SVIO_087510 [Streptomyces violaceusniger]
MIPVFDSVPQAIANGESGLYPPHCAKERSERPHGRKGAKEGVALVPALSVVSDALSPHASDDVGR